MSYETVIEQVKMLPEPLSALERLINTLPDTDKRQLSKYNSIKWARDDVRSCCFGGIEQVHRDNRTVKKSAEKIQKNVTPYRNYFKSDLTTYVPCTKAPHSPA